MLKKIFNIHPQHQQKIAIIGAGAMGVSTGCILARLGIAQVTLFEAESKPFNSKGSSTNNTGILHHFVYGGHPHTLEHLFKQSILFRKLMPDYVFGDSSVNYLVPNDQENTALHQDGVTFKDVANSLIDIYNRHLKRYPDDNFLGKPEELVKTLNEDEIQSVLGNMSSSIDTISGGVKVKQSVLNLGEYVCHMIRVIELLVKHKLLTVNYHQKITHIDINPNNFELTINHHLKMDFDTVINAGYAKGLELPILEQKEQQDNQGNLVKLKVYGLYKIPNSLKLKFPGLQENFSSTIFIRGQYGGIIKVGYNFLAAFSGSEYNQDEFDFPLKKLPRNIPKKWFKSLDEITGRKEEEVLISIQSELSRWIPWAQELERVKLKKAVQVYPGRKFLNALDSAKRDDNPIRYLYQHQQGGQYIHIPGFKLTSIPYQSCQIILSILSSYVVQELISQEEVNKHIRIDENSNILLSSEMESTLGKNLSQLNILDRKKIIKNWNIY